MEPGYKSLGLYLGVHAVNSTSCSPIIIKRTETFTPLSSQKEANWEGSDLKRIEFLVPLSTEEMMVTSETQE